MRAVLLFSCCALATLAAAQIVEEELVTVTDVAAVLTWRTDDALDSTVVFGRCGAAERDSVTGLLRGSDLVRVQAAANETHHYAEINGLLPGACYTYQTRSGSFVGEVTRFSPGQFTTLVPPSGQLLFTFATLNDMHVGEKTAGLIVINNRTLTPGFEWPDDNNPYWKFSNEAAVRAINSVGVEFTVAKGDISSDFKEEEFQAAKQILDRLDRPYYVLRGNHDRVGSSPQDFYKVVFGITATYYSFDHKGVHFVALDSVRLSDGHPELVVDQLNWLRADLESNKDKRTFVFLHHAVTAEAFIWSLEPEDRDAFLGIVEANPQVVGVFSGHSHRSKVTHSPRVSNIFFPETPASKEYPLGFSLYRVYTNGFVQTFHRANCAECLVWNSMTRQMFFRTAPFTQLGEINDRNYVYLYK